MSRRLAIAAFVAVTCGLAAVVAAALGQSATSGSIVKFQAVLTPGQETGAPALTRPGEKGLFTATFDRGRATLTWRLTYLRISSAPIWAQIRKGKRGQEGESIVTLCNYVQGPLPCRSGAHATFGKKQGVYAYMLGELLKGAYVEIATKVNTYGEMRGQLRVVS